MDRPAATSIEERDAIVVGGNVAGLVVACFLASWGYRTRLVERAPFLGGVDRSFRNRNGRIFDFGLHVLDYMRSELTTRLFESVVDREVYKLERSRAVVLRNHLIPYNAPRDAWPEQLQALLPDGELVDGLGTERPTRENLARYYGAFSDLIFDETLPSYPSEHRHTKFGVEEWKLMPNIYPWFFPRARRQVLDINESRKYQDQVREQPREYMLYPKQGGFGTFAEGFQRRLLDLGAEILTNARDLHVAFDPSTRHVDYVEACGQRATAPRIYWCAAPAALCEALSLPVPNLTPDVFALGSFELEGPVRCDYTEVILGDPEHAINRISFPGKLGRVDDNLVQLEFAFPAAGTGYDTKESYWLEQWTRSLHRLGIVDPTNRVVDFDCRIFPIFYNVFGAEGAPIPELDFSTEIPPESNLKPVLPTYRKVNINTRVPQYLEFLSADVLGRR